MHYETLKNMINCLDEMKKEGDRFNKGMEKILGSDSSSMYYVMEEIYEKFIINTLIVEFNESKEGAEWFIHEGLSQIKNGGTSIEENGKIWDIKILKDYYDYLVSLQKK